MLQASICISMTLIITTWQFNSEPPWTPQLVYQNSHPRGQLLKNAVRATDFVEQKRLYSHFHVRLTSGSTKWSFTHSLTLIVLVVTRYQTEVAAPFLQYRQGCSQVPRSTVTFRVEFVSWLARGRSGLNVDQIHIVIHEYLQHVRQSSRAIAILREDHARRFRLLRLILFDNIGSAILQGGLIRWEWIKHAVG